MGFLSWFSGKDLTSVFIALLSILIIGNHLLTHECTETYNLNKLKSIVP
ncbi:hypothetical protein BCAH1134_C0489 (plasmid) [Bacillus cereus AH1134]|nr:hypothetical protein BCAH1134_C0489 [Bacillus cereus AH1134]